MFKSLFQTPVWARFKEGFGWSAAQYADLLGLERVIGAGRSMLYFPEIPLDEQFRGALGHIKTVPLRNRIFTRFEFLELWTPERAKLLLESGLVKAFEDVQPDYRQWILLEGGEDDLLKQMKPKGRYNIRVAERHALNVEWRSDEKAADIFFSLYASTSKRTGFSGRGREYFRSLVAMLGQEKAGDVVIVSKDGQPLSAGIVTFYGGAASYLYGGSGGDRSLMAPYLMHWEIIKRAKKEGLAVYDLLAIGPPDEPNHPHAQLTRFKTQFGGQSVRLLGSWDLVHRPTWYMLYRFAQTKRRRAI